MPPEESGGFLFLGKKKRRPVRGGGPTMLILTGINIPREHHSSVKNIPDEAKAKKTAPGNASSGPTTMLSSLNCPQNTGACLRRTDL